MKPVVQTKISVRAPDGTMIIKGNCYASCWASILEIPLNEVPAFEDLPDDGSWFRETWKWLNSLGLQLGYSNMEDVPDNEFTIACGPSPRGPWGHCVVYYNHQFAHDPYPNGSGLSKVNYHLWAIPNQK